MRLERLQWLETVSGAGEWKKKLYRSFLSVWKKLSRRLLEERLKRAGPSSEKWKLWAGRRISLLERNGKGKPEHSIFREMIRLRQKKVSLLKKK